MLYGDVETAMIAEVLCDRMKRPLRTAMKRYAAMPDGLYPLEDGCFCLVQTYFTRLITEAEYERHERYIDIQVMLEGSEAIAVAPVDALVGWLPFDAQKDIGFCPLSPAADMLTLRPKQFAMLGPQDAHMPSCHTAGEAKRVRKLVVKVPV